jgi:hypothetical protein
MANKDLRVLFLSLFLTNCAQADSSGSDFSSLYIGLSLGYGSTIWDGLVPAKGNKNPAVLLSTPKEVKEGGAVYGGILGYEFSPNFALELGYFKYPNATIIFDKMSLFNFNHKKTEFNSHTDYISVMAKLMLPFPNSKVRFFSSLGAASVRREDMLLDERKLSPSFGAGINFPVTDRLQVEIGGVYVAGFGESQLNPSNSYFPFLYSAGIRMAYYF